MTDLLVIGGGAAGLMAAGAACARGLTVTVLEHNPKGPGQKLLITGKGRCNVTSDSDVREFLPYVRHNGRFLYSSLYAFPPSAAMELFESLGVPLKTERGNRVFPASDKAVDIVDALVRYAREGGCRFREGRAARLLIEDGVCCGAALENGEQLAAYAVAVCTGGLSYPQTGSTGDGYALARQAGHTIVPTRPSLVPLESGDAFCARLQGLSLKNCALTVTDRAAGRVIYRDFGEMLFTHFGVSGPMILSASAHMREMAPARYLLSIDLKPALSPEQLDARLLRELEQEKNRDFGNMLGALLPRKLVPVAAERADIPPDRKCHTVTREERRRLGALLKAFTVEITGFRPVAEAVVTAGGVSVREISAKTMESKLVSGLYFAGEVLDVDAYTGGFNLQIAFATGMAAGAHMAG